MIVLQVLDQEKQFDSLHFFSAARHVYARERAGMEEVVDPEGGGMSSLQKWSQKVGAMTEEETLNIESVRCPFTC